MLRKPLALLMVAILLAVAFCAGVAQLFQLRYEGGDVYPPYSTLRTDPLGAKALYEALGELGELELRRNYRPLVKLKPAAPVTLVYAGIKRVSMWGDDEWLEFNGLIHRGSRAVFAFYPEEHSVTAEEEKRLDEQARKEKREKQEAKKAEEKAKEKKSGAASEDKKGEKKDDQKDESAKDEKSDSKKRNDKEEELKSSLLSFKEAASRLGFAFDFQPADAQKAFHRSAVSQEKEGVLERSISWHSALYFKDLAPEWKVLYKCNDRPVVIERKFGSGSMLFAADSFFLSNEALRSDRASKFLAHLFDGPGDVVFDEEHHGIREEAGIATLARKYRLQGVVGGLLLLTALFVWKNAVRFLPAYSAGEASGGVVAGKDSTEGFVNMLRRSIGPAEILGVCVGEWRKSFPHHLKEQAKVDEIFGQEQARPSKERNAAAAYHAICQALARKR